MTLNEYQEAAMGSAIYKRDGAQGLTYSVLALNGEAGELANELKKALRVGTDPDRLALALELGDVLWYAAATANELNMTLQEIALLNLQKLAERRKHGKVTG